MIAELREDVEWLEGHELGDLDAGVIVADEGPAADGEEEAEVLVGGDGDLREVDLIVAPLKMAAVLARLQGVSALLVGEPDRLEVVAAEVDEEFLLAAGQTRRQHLLRDAEGLARPPQAQPAAVVGDEVPAEVRRGRRWERRGRVGEAVRGARDVAELIDMVVTIAPEVQTEDGLVGEIVGLRQRGALLLGELAHLEIKVHEVLVLGEQALAALQEGDATVGELVVAEVEGGEAHAGSHGLQQLARALVAELVPLHRELLNRVLRQHLCQQPHRLVPQAVVGQVHHPQPPRPAQLLLHAHQRQVRQLHAHQPHLRCSLLAQPPQLPLQPLRQQRQVLLSVRVGESEVAARLLDLTVRLLDLTVHLFDPGVAAHLLDLGLGGVLPDLLVDPLLQRAELAPEVARVPDQVREEHGALVPAHRDLVLLPPLQVCEQHFLGAVCLRAALVLQLHLLVQLLQLRLPRLRSHPRLWRRLWGLPLQGCLCARVVGQRFGDGVFELERLLQVLRFLFQLCFLQHRFRLFYEQSADQWAVQFTTGAQVGGKWTARAEGKGGEIKIIINVMRLARVTQFSKAFWFGSRKPVFRTPSAEDETIRVVHPDDAAQHLPPHKLAEFLEKKVARSVVLSGEGASLREATTLFYSDRSWKKINDISRNTSVHFSDAIQNAANFAGLASEVLTKAYKFSRKEKAEKAVEVGVGEVREREYILELAGAKVQAAEWAGSRGNERNTAQLLEEAQRIAAAHSLGIKVIRGEQLLHEGFSLLHAVGRASKNEPIFVSLEWRGASESQPFVGLVGKGLCFDAGGLNLKPTSGIGGMHNDKHGACSVLSAFESAVRLKLPLNLVAVVGLAENFVSSESYRPLDIIRSRKGLTVEIGNTDAEGRLVLADCMHWVQENYRVGTLLELSTLTGAIIVALGKERAGLFSNSPALASSLLERGEQIEERLWHMPVDDYHAELIKPKTADLSNSPGKAEGSACQAAAFLRNFVEKGVEWAHIDIAGVAGSDSNSTGYGAKLLLHYLREHAKI